MVKVYLTTNDPIVITVMDEKECNYMFGDDFILDYGVDIPEQLLKDYKRVYFEFQEIQEHLRYYKLD